MSGCDIKFESIYYQQLIMHIHRGLLLVLVVMFIFSPTIQNWVSNNNGQWFRPFLVWAIVIAFAYMTQHLKQNK